MAHARSAIDGRLAALARAHALLTRVSWDNATIDSTIGSAIVPFDQGGWPLLNFRRGDSDYIEFGDRLLVQSRTGEISGYV